MNGSRNKIPNNRAPTSLTNQSTDRLIN